MTPIVRNVIRSWYNYGIPANTFFSYEECTTYRDSGHVRTVLLASISVNDDEIKYVWTVNSRPEVKGFADTVKEAKRLCIAICALEGI